MDKLITDNKEFKKYKMCRYATDMTFQQSFTPGGSIQEVIEYFYGKHKLYGFTVEVSVLTNGLAIGVNEPYPGSVLDIDILFDMISFHDDVLEKSGEQETAITDISVDSCRFPNILGALLDKEYYGIESDIRAVILKKKPAGGVLNLTKRMENEAISSDRIIVEKFFGQQGALWAVACNKYR